MSQQGGGGKQLKFWEDKHYTPELARGEQHVSLLYLIREVPAHPASMIEPFSY